MQFDDIETPALLLDTSRTNRNIARMQTHIQKLGVRFRPHLKTNKSIDVTRRLFEGGTGPVTVSMLKEAEYFFGHGFTDILYAVGITQTKLRHVADLRARGCDLKIILDNSEAAGAVAALAHAGGRRLDCERYGTTRMLGQPGWARA
jgi:D-serine deaminase-like pyridoxal phosphate-dependent protein